MKRTRALILLLGLGMTTGALADMRTYDVDARYRQEVYAALRGVLSTEGAKSPEGVQLLPTGQLLVNASSETQEQVAAVLESISNHHVEATPRVTLRYWAVLGTKGSQQDASIGEGTEVPAILSGVLDELRRVHGNLAFRLYGNASLVSDSGQEGTLSGKPLNISQLAYVQQSKLDVELSIFFDFYIRTLETYGPDEQKSTFPTLQRFSHAVKINTSLAPNEFVVVGENTVRSSEPVEHEIDGTIFFIVQWPVAD